MSQKEAYELLKLFNGSATASELSECALKKGMGLKNLFRDLAGLRKNEIVLWVPKEHRYVLIGKFEREEKPADCRKLIIIRK